MADTLWHKMREKGAALRLRLFSNWKVFHQRMRQKHRIVVLNTDTFKEHLSFELTGTNIFLAVGSSAILLIVLTTLLIAFTPLRQIIPGYVNTDMVEQTYRNAHDIDSLETLVSAQEQMIANMQQVIAGNDISLLSNVTLDTASPQEIAYTHSRADTLLRREIERLK